MTGLSFGRRIANRTTGALLIILLLALALRLLFFVGMARYDDYGYAQTAYGLANGVYRVAGFNLHHQARLAIVLPVAISFRLFGVNEYSAELWPLLCAVGSIVAIFYLGKLLFDQRTGLLAAVLLSFFPLEVVYSTQLLPDVIQPFFLAASVLCFLKGHHISNRRASCVWFSLSWLFIGVAFFTRESGIMILLFHIAYIVYNRTVRKEYLAAGAFVAALSLAIGLVYLRVQGNPLAGLQYISGLIRFGSVDHLHRATTHFAKRWLDYIQMLATQPQFRYFTAATAIGFGYLVWRRDRHLYVPALWLLSLLLYLEVLSSMHFMRRLDRYLTILTIPALLIVARFLVVIARPRGTGIGLSLSRAFPARNCQRLGTIWRQKLIPRPWRRLMVGLIIGFLFAQSVPPVAEDAGRYRFNTFRFREAGHFLATLPQKDIYLPESKQWLWRMNFYLGFDTGYNIFGTPEQNENSILKPLPETGLEQISDSYAVTDQWAKENGQWFVREKMEVPDWWERLRRIKHGPAKTFIYYTGKTPTS